MKRRAPWQLRAMALLLLVCCCGGPELELAQGSTDGGAGGGGDPGTLSCSFVADHLECRFLVRR